ncbi:sugar phosphate isomerase/epimerase [Microbacterium resistens]|uniref:Sugar phosphate isomerase/epimerase n=1 Tax=Microbacterium resistens TaxID=156977 RepID=A0ABU1SC76_9MICO|nr:TIM barrel protein [Microbacterium resistens]MDR6867154.1 sugar phosphate isomerase/epimerase [Microbacterium resistens]
MSIRPGLCSVTFRELPPARVAALAAEAGLQVIEWGGDVHVPPGDVRGAAAVAGITADAGLVVCSYGSYFRATPRESITPVLDSASALGADRVRVWAGVSGSAEASERERAGVVDALARASAEADDRGMTLALEYHGGTLADTPEAVLGLLGAVGSTALTTYWQPTVAASDETALAEYALLADRVSAVHVFSWWPRTERLPLRDREALWRGFGLAANAASRPPRDALLEFVPGDDPSVLAAEARSLRQYLQA